MQIPDGASDTIRSAGCDTAATAGDGSWPAAVEFTIQSISTRPFGFREWSLEDARAATTVLDAIGEEMPGAIAEFSANLARNLSGRLRRADEQVRMLAR